MTMRTFLTRYYGAIWMTLLIGWFLFATLPYLESYPRMEWAQPMIAAPAWKLATTGVYGSDMFTGFYGSEAHNYDHLPLYPLFIALVFKIGGLGIIQARLVSVISGLAVLLTTYFLGKRLYDPPTGLVAATFLCTLRISFPNFIDILRLGYQMNASGIPLIDFARVIRFDVMVPVWVVAACLVFYRAVETDSKPGFLITGVLVGLAVLTHVYGGFILPVLIIAIFWRSDRTNRKVQYMALLLAGLGLTILPYIVYILQDVGAFRGQSLRHQNRYDLLNPAFYWDSLIHEPWRFISWLGGSFRNPVLWPRIGIYILAGAIGSAQFILLRRVRKTGLLADKLTLLSLPVLVGLLALLINIKRYQYTALLLPFLALQASFVFVWLWKSGKKRRKTVLAVILALTILEGGAGVIGMQRAAPESTPYETIRAELVAFIPPDSRVLSTHLAWFALADTQFRSANLLFVLTDETIVQDPPDVASVIAEIDPDYIVIEERLLKIYLTEPELLPNLEIADVWRAFDATIQANCTLIGRIPVPEYGDIVVHDCN